LPISEESKRIAITALAPSSLAFSIIRSIACRRASSRTTVNCDTSPWRSDDIPPVTALLKPMERTTRPNVMPRFRSTLMPGNSNAEVTGNMATGDSAEFIMVRSRQVPQARVNEALLPTLTSKRGRLRH
jgi:hypothetical protein